MLYYNMLRLGVWYVGRYSLGRIHQKIGCWKLIFNSVNFVCVYPSNTQLPFKYSQWLIKFYKKVNKKKIVPMKPTFWIVYLESK